MYLLKLEIVTVIIPIVQMRKQRFTEFKHYYKPQGYFNRIQRNKAIMRRIPFVFKRLCLCHTPSVAAPPTCS